MFQKINWIFIHKMKNKNYIKNSYDDLHNRNFVRRVKNAKNDEKTKEILLLKMISDYINLKKRENHRKKLQSNRNKRYYQRHKQEILKKNKEMRDVYKVFKQR